MKLNKDFWNRRYQEGNTGWDVGAITTPLKEYFQQLEDTNLKILIPGAGNSYEAEFLFEKGFKNTIVIDISDVVLENFKNRNPEFPPKNLVNKDFFEAEGSFDLIIEQTFFCALDPKYRPAYASKMYELLKKGGKLVGVLFDDPLNVDHPPFGGNEAEYRNYFEPWFHLIVFESCYNSIKPRVGRELFMILEKN